MAPFSSYSYSEEIFGLTPNAAQNDAYNWVMANILPQQAGLTVNGVYYRYTTTKDPADDMLVHIQNENALGDGYIFRETDDWSGQPGNTINKTIPVNRIGLEFWGDGSIEVEGFGTVSDATVVYSYQYDTCFDPQTSPDCPDYVEPYIPTMEEPEAVDPLDDDIVQDELDRKANMRAQKEEEERQDRRKLTTKIEKEKERLEVLLGITEENDFSMEQLILHNQLMALASLPQSYLNALVGGTYEDTVVLVDSKLPNNSRALRVGMAQQKLHQELVDLQYAK